MTLCSPCSVSLSVHITDLIGECQRNICTSQRKANLFFLEKKVAEVPKSCKRLMPLDTVPIYIYVLFNPIVVIVTVLGNKWQQCVCFEVFGV